MARNSSNLSEAITFLEIIKRIPLRKKITSTEIHNSLGAHGIKITKRTLQRYLEALSTSNLGIVCDKTSIPYGYSKEHIVEGLESFRLDAHSRLLLRLAQEHLQYQMPSDLTKSLDFLFKKSKDEKEGQEDRKTKNWLQKVAVVSGVVPHIPPKILPRIFNAVSEGLFEEKQLIIDYEKPNGERKQVEVAPLGLVQQELRLYLVAQYVESGEIRHFVLHRMKNVEVTNFVNPDTKFSLKKYLQDQPFNDFSSTKRVNLEIVFRSPILAVNMEESPFNKTQNIEKLQDGTFKLTCEIEDGILLNGWFGMWYSSADFISVKKDGKEAKFFCIGNSSRDA